MKKAILLAALIAAFGAQADETVVNLTGPDIDLTPAPIEIEETDDGQTIDRYRWGGHCASIYNRSKCGPDAVEPDTNGGPGVAADEYPRSKQGYLWND